MSNRRAGDRSFEKSRRQTAQIPRLPFTTRGCQRRFFSLVFMRWLVESTMMEELGRLVEAGLYAEKDGLCAGAASIASGFSIANPIILTIPGLGAGTGRHAHEGIDLLVPIRREHRIGAGSKPHCVA